jgi:hypothetical protein
MPPTVNIYVNNSRNGKKKPPGLGDVIESLPLLVRITPFSIPSKRADRPGPRQLLIRDGRDSGDADDESGRVGPLSC